jgi:hypothetical protein
MLLSEDAFEGIAQLFGGSFAAGAAGQRRGPRATLDARLTIVPCPDGPDRAEQAFSVPLRDLSRGGLRFLHNERLPLDTPIIALLPRPRQLGASAAEQPLAVLAVVAYWQPLARDLFALGAEFRRVLSGVDLSALQKQPTVVLPGLVGSERPASQTVEALRRVAG